MKYEVIFTQKNEIVWNYFLQGANIPPWVEKITIEITPEGYLNMKQMILDEINAGKSLISFLDMKLLVPNRPDRVINEDERARVSQDIEVLTEFYRYLENSKPVYEEVSHGSEG